jgi:perosamine synthetase
MSETKDFIPVSKPSIGPLELEYVAKAVGSTWVGSTGEYLDKLRREFAEEIGAKYAIPVTNGTVALHLALMAIGVSAGDEVIVPSLTYIAPVNAIRYCGAVPVFADVENDSWCIDPNQIVQLITPRTKAIIAVHLYGMPATMNKIIEIAKAHGIYVIEDAAEAMFAKFENTMTGNIGDIATFSLFGNKILTSGEGGIITTNNDKIASEIELLRGQGMDPNRRYWFPKIGFNYRMTNISAAIFCAQFSRREELQAKRWEIYNTYDNYFNERDELQIQTKLHDRSRSPWLYPVLISNQSHSNREEVMSRLEEMGIETRPFFIPIHEMPPYKSFRPRLSMEVTHHLASRGFNLPTFPELKKQEMLKIANVLIEAIS